MGEFGDKFRKAREKKDISLDAVSNVTKISSRMLKAIEEENFDQLPGGVFNKGFIRAYAKHLGMDAEEAVTDYLACLRQAQIDAHEVWEPERPAMVGPAQARSATPQKRFVEPSNPAGKPRVPLQVEELPDLQLPRAEHVRPPRKYFSGNSNVEIPWRIVAIAAVVVVLAIILWVRRSHTHIAATSSPAMSEPATVPSAAASAPVNQAPQSSTASSTTAAASTPSPGRPAGAQPSGTAHGPAATPAASSIATSEGGTQPNDGTTRTENQPASMPSAKSTAPLKLVIRANETSWISLIADGQTVSRETLIAPAHASVRANHEIIAKIGNAAGVTFLWNGKEIPADGAEAEVKTFVFDADGMRVLPSTQLIPGR